MRSHPKTRTQFRWTSSLLLLCLCVFRVEAMRQANWRDSLAIAMLFGQLEKDIGQEKRCDLWTEVSAAHELELYRSLMDFNLGQSFETVSAYGPNAANIHYKPDPTSEHQVHICNQSTYLLDSGGLYLDGATNITRTVHFGKPTDFQRETYTRVLMGAIDMMSLIFERTHEQASFRLNDLIARRHLLDIGLNYEHGTGHGIGLYSQLHAAPTLISNYNQEPAPVTKASVPVVGQQSEFAGPVQTVQIEPLSIRENMFTSIEPGYYKPNEFGIRLENIVVTQKMPFNSIQPNPMNQTSTGQREWLRFEPISLVPFEPKLIKFELLSNKQKVWLNSYNLMVRLRMTQQVNYYLAKVLSNQNQRQQVQVMGTSSSSRLYRQLQEQNQQQQTGGNLSALANEARRNFSLRIEPIKFQQLLEQAHRWIMSKTELIPLDVPQKLVRVIESGGWLTGRVDSSMSSQAEENFNNANQLDQTRRTPTQDEWSSLGANAQGQRLVLAYMASLPFNDADAANKLSTTLFARSQVDSGSNADNLDQRQQAANRSAQLPARTGSFGHKCSGLECDLLLLEALNSHQRRAVAGVKQKELADDSDDLLQDSVAHDQKRGGQQMLLDMFQLSSAPDDSSSRLSWPLASSVWPILGLALVLVLQLAVMIYVCSSGAGSGGGPAPRNGAAGALSLARRQSLEPAWSLSSNSSQKHRLGCRHEMLANGQQQQQHDPPASATNNGEQPLPIVVTQNI